MDDGWWEYERYRPVGFLKPHWSGIRRPHWSGILRPHRSGIRVEASFKTCGGFKNLTGRVLFLVGFFSNAYM